MKLIAKKINLVLFLLFFLLFNLETFGKEAKFRYSQKNISNYFSGIVSLNQDNTTTGFKYLNKVQSIKKSHFNYNKHFIRALILLEKFEQSFTFSKSVWSEDQIFFEADLLLGLESFLKKDYLTAEKHFKRLNKISKSNLIFEDFFGNIFISWIKASENNQKESFKFLNKIPGRYENLIKIQNSFLQCYFNTSKTETVYKELIKSEDSGFSRYNVFFANYLISKNKVAAASKLIKNSLKRNNSNLLIKQTELFISNKNLKKIKKLFNCKEPKDAIAELFYVIANLYSTQQNYELSNFYLNISLFLNNKFTPNEVLRAENFFFQKKYDLSKKTYNSVKSIGEVYFWYASKNIALILSESSDKEKATSVLKKAFNSVSKPTSEHYYELANYYKNNEYYEESIKYYSLALKNIKNEEHLIPKILERRGSSYERIDQWDKAEKDLIESLKISPNEPYVLNYLAYSWAEKRINVEKALGMLKKAVELRKNDGYITDSLGWAYYVNENYLKAEKFLQRAVELMPLDPIINDHYGDVLWMLNRNVQARYFWNYVLSLEDVEEKLKENIKKKLIFGITKKL